MIVHFPHDIIRSNRIHLFETRVPSLWQIMAWQASQSSWSSTEGHRAGIPPAFTLQFFLRISSNASLSSACDFHLRHRKKTRPHSNICILLKSIRQFEQRDKNWLAYVRLWKEPLDKVSIFVWNEPLTIITIWNVFPMKKHLSQYSSYKGHKRILYPASLNTWASLAGP